MPADRLVFGVGLDDGLDDPLGIGRHLEIGGLAFDEIDRLAAQAAGERVLVLTERHGRACGQVNAGSHMTATAIFSGLPILRALAR